MKKLIAAQREVVDALSNRLNNAKNHSEKCRIQCVLLRIDGAKTAGEIASQLGWSVGSVHVLHSKWARFGDAIFDVQGRGGRRRSHMTWDEEAAFLAQYLNADREYLALTVDDLQREYQGRVGKVVATSTIYRLLNRHGWGKGATPKEALLALDREMACMCKRQKLS